MTTCRFCNGEVRSVINYGMFPAAPRCTETVENELFEFCVGACLNCGLIQLKYPADPMILYASFKNDIVSEKLDKHYTFFNDFILTFYRTGNQLLEIGAGVGKLANMICRKISKSSNLSVVDINLVHENYPNQICMHDGIFEETSFNEKKFDLLYSSHVFEHIDNIKDHIEKIKSLITIGGKFVISLPNFNCWIKDKYLNAFSQEHPIYPRQNDINLLMTKAGFKLIQSKEYLDHSLFVAFEYQGTKATNIYTEFREKNESNSIEILKKFDAHLTSLNTFINKTVENKNIWIFGANSSSQFIIQMLSNKSMQIKGLLDNSKLKQNNYLYGTRLKTFSPSIVETFGKNDIVLVFTGAFIDEILEQLYEINTNLNIVSFHDYANSKDKVIT